MTTYNTGNPLGSASPKDLFDNAENLDQAVNNLVSRTWTDRRGTLRRTFKGMEMDFNDFIAASGFVNLGAYASGLVISSYNQTFTRSGFAYRASPSTVLPYTTTGNWATEEIKFVIAGDSTLRQDLALPTGANLVGFKYSGTGSTLRTLEQVVRSTGTLDVRGFGALGDGIADDTAAITAAAAAAYASGAMLLLPSGGIFNTTGQLDIKVALQGYGATLVNITAAEKADKFANATIILNAVGASVSGLRIVCNHKTSGISAKSIAAAIVRDVQIIDPIMAGVCFEDVASATVTNSFMQDVRCNSVELDSADGVYSLNCTSFSAEGIRVVGFQRSAVYTKQIVAGNNTSNLYKVEAVGGNYPYPSVVPLCLAGVVVDSVSSCSVDGVIVSGMPDSAHPSAPAIGGFTFINEATLYAPVLTATRIQINGKVLTGSTTQGLVFLGSGLNAVVSIDTLDLQGLVWGVKAYSGVKSLTISNVIGRNLDYSSSGSSLISTTVSGLETLDLSNIQDISPVIAGVGATATTMNLSASGTNISVRDCATRVSLQCSSAKSLNINNCLDLQHKASNPFSAALSLTITNTTLTADPASLKSLFSGTPAVKLSDSTIDGFSGTVDYQPQSLMMVNCTSNGSFWPISANYTVISACRIISGFSSSPLIVLGPTASYSSAVVNVSNTSLVMGGATYAIITQSVNSPKSYVISGVQWTGGLSDITNFDVAKGTLVANRKVP